MFVRLERKGEKIFGFKLQTFTSHFEIIKRWVCGMTCSCVLCVVLLRSYYIIRLHFSVILMLIALLDAELVAQTPDIHLGKWH